ncbi:MAG: hypothetical protein HZA12_00715, partial [Nitrospirae bacterium]|nr:hypothetical protein [Nitrospirota bacterium]
TYSLQMGILPTRFPVNLFAQRNVISVENAPDLISDTYSIGWYTTIRTQTSLRVTLLQIGTEYDDPVNHRDTRVRIANLGLTQQFRTGSLSGNLQYTDYLVTEKDKPPTSSKVSSYSIRGETRLTPTLFLNGNVTYFPKGSFFTPGITTTSETTGEIGLLHQVERFTQSGSYNFRKTPGGEIERDTISYNMNYRPLGKTDYRTDALYSATKSQQTDTKEYRVAGGISHRPFYGLSITANMILNHFDVSGIAESRTDRAGMMAGVNYYKLLDMFNLNSNYSADYSMVFSDKEEANGGILTQSASLGLQTRTLQAAQIMGAYTVLLRNNNIVPTDNRQEQTLRLEAISSYFRRWILRASTNFSDVLDYGNTFIFDTRGEYFPMLGTNLAGGYRFSNFPGATNTQDSQSLYLEGTHYRYLTRRLSLNMNARGEREAYLQTNIERNRLTFTSALNYQLGKININFEFREDYTKYPESVYNIQSYFVRASRPF